jgi:hypothetical protein
VARWKNNSTTNLTAGGKQKAASMNDRAAAVGVWRRCMEGGGKRTHRRLSSS